MDKASLVNLLKQGKQVRIKYNDKNDDGCTKPGWWSEELWEYNLQLDLFRCYYPVSSYDKNYYTEHTEKEVLSVIEDAIYDIQIKNNNGIIVTDIVVEDKSLEEVNSISKSIIVIDTPESCKECKMLQKDEYDEYSCGAAHYCIDKEDLNKKQEYCPLKELPEKQETNPSKPYLDYEDGWNDCIDVILELEDKKLWKEKMKEKLVSE